MAARSPSGARGTACYLLRLSTLSVLALLFLARPASAEVAVADIDIASGSVTGGIGLSGSTVRTTQFVEDFATNPYAATGCNTGGTANTLYTEWPSPNEWAYNASDKWLWYSGTPGAGVGTLDILYTRGGGTTSGNCDAGPYDFRSDLSMTARFSIYANSGSILLGIGFAGGTGVRAGPAVHLSPAASNTSISFRVCVYNNTATCASGYQYPGMVKNAWYTLWLNYSAVTGTANATVAGGEQSVAATWTSANSQTHGTFVAVIGASLAEETIAAEVDDLTVPRYRVGHWTSAPLAPSVVLRLAATYSYEADQGNQLPADRDDGVGWSVGPWYGNASGSAVWERTTLTTSGSSVSFDDSGVTSGRLSDVPTLWTLALRLISDDGLSDPTRVSTLAVEWSRPDGGTGGDPLRVEDPCEGAGFLTPGCRALPPEIVTYVIRPVCNLWAFAFLVLVLATYAAARRARLRGPRMSP